MVPEAKPRERRAAEHRLVRLQCAGIALAAQRARCLLRLRREGEAQFDQLGANLNVLPPGVPMAMYHEEPGQEDFLVLRGECLLIVEGQERPLGRWDFVHCPPLTKHVIVGAGTEPALVLGVGARKGQATYPFDEAAVRHGAGAERATDSPAEAYARFSRPEKGPAPELP